MTASGDGRFVGGGGEDGSDGPHPGLAEGGCFDPSDILDLDLDILPEAPPPPGFDLDRAGHLVRYVLRHELASGPWRVTVALVDDARLQALHRDFMGIDEPTDVMTFPADEPGIGGGDIAVSVDRAAEQGPPFGHTAAEETAFLVVHGLLHLCGWDDAAPEDRVAMLDRQAELVRGFGRGSGAERPRAG